MLKMMPHHVICFQKPQLKRSYFLVEIPAKKRRPFHSSDAQRTAADIIWTYGRKNVVSEIHLDIVE